MERMSYHFPLFPFLSPFTPDICMKRRFHPGKADQMTVRIPQIKAKLLALSKWTVLLSERPKQWSGEMYRYLERLLEKCWPKDIKRVVPPGLFTHLFTIDILTASEEAQTPCLSPRSPWLSREDRHANKRRVFCESGGHWVLEENRSHDDTKAVTTELSTLTVLPFQTPASLRTTSLSAALFDHWGPSGVSRPETKWKTRNLQMH